MTTYQYTDSSNAWVAVYDDDGITRTSITSALVPEGATVEPYVPTTAEINAPILAQLAANDVKIIRAIAEGDTARIASHNAAQAALRAQLV